LRGRPHGALQFEDASQDPRHLRRATVGSTTALAGAGPREHGRQAARSVPDRPAGSESNDGLNTSAPPQTALILLSY
jgi:hypothetical protein